MARNDPGNNDKFLKLILVVAVVVFGGYLVFGGDDQPRQQVYTPAQASVGGGGGQPVVVYPPQQPGLSAANTYHSGTLTLKPKAADGTNGISSSMLFLHKSEARDVNGNPIWDVNGNQLSNAAFDEMKTRYSIMKKVATYGTTTVGNDGLKYFGANAINAVSSGAWAQTINGNEKDMLIAYTFVASGTSYAAPVHSTNISTVKLIKLSGWNDPNQNWDAQLWDGASPDWKIMIYPNATFVDDTGVRRDNYTVGDSGTVKTKQTWKFYINGTNVGEDPTTADIGLFLTGPKNLTSKFNELTLSPRSTTGKGSVRIVSLSTVFNDGADSLTCPNCGSVDQAASLLTGNATTFNDQLYYLGTIPKDWITERTSSDRNQIEGTFTSETFSTDVKTTLWLVQNVHAKGTSNGAFVNAEWFDLQFSNGGSTGYDIAP